MAITLNGTTGIVTPKLDALDLELGSKNVVERGSNANGEYVRFADGTQICIMTLTASTAISTPVVGGFRSVGSALVGTFPASFSAPPAIVASADNVTCTSAAPSSGDVTTSMYGLLVTAVTSQADESRTAHACAIGRWY